MPEERRVRLPDSVDLKRQLVEKIRTALSDEDIETVNDEPINVPPVVYDTDDTDDMHIDIVLPPIVIDDDPSD
jgi:hypothetical protein